MGWFSSTPQAKATPVRRDKVVKMLKAAMDENEAADRIDDGPEYERRYAAADRRRQDAFKGATPAERKAAQEAMRRHNYS